MSTVEAVLAAVAEEHRFSAYDGDCDCGEHFPFGALHAAHLAHRQAAALRDAGLLKRVSIPLSDTAKAKRAERMARLTDEARYPDA